MCIEQIKQRVSMRDVLEKYGYEVKRRMRCPLHNGDGLNFVIDGDHYYCFSQCGGGDVLDFVQKLFGLSFPAAVEKVKSDFGIDDTPCKQSVVDFMIAESAEYKRKREEQAKAAELSAYFSLIEADAAVMAAAKSAEGTITDKLAEALKRRERLERE